MNMDPYLFIRALVDLFYMCRWLRRCRNRIVNSFYEPMPAAAVRPQRVRRNAVQPQCPRTLRTLNGGRSRLDGVSQGGPSMKPRYNPHSAVQLACGVFLLVVTSGCAVSHNTVAEGREFDVSKSSGISVGMDIQDAEHLLGKPMSRGRSLDHGAFLEYKLITSNFSTFAAGIFIMGASSSVGQEGEELKLYFDPTTNKITKIEKKTYGLNKYPTVAKES